MAYVSSIGLLFFVSTWLLFIPGINRAAIQRLALYCNLFCVSVFRLVPSQEFVHARNLVEAGTLAIPI